MQTSGRMLWVACMLLVPWVVDTHYTGYTTTTLQKPISHIFAVDWSAEDTLRVFWLSQSRALLTYDSRFDNRGLHIALVSGKSCGHPFC